MPGVYKTDLHRYVRKDDIRQLRRNFGSALYLPDGKGLQYMNKFQDVEINGEGFWDTITTGLNFIKNNKDGIASVIDSVDKVAKVVTNTVKGAEEIKLLREQRKKQEDANAKSKEGIASHPTVSGSALYLPEGSGYSLSTPTISHTNDEVIEKILKKGSGFKILNN